jgi:hypothetical protein
LFHKLGLSQKEFFIINITNKIQSLKLHDGKHLVYILLVFEREDVFFQKLKSKPARMSTSIHHVHEKGSSRQLPSEYHPPRVLAMSYTKQ